MSSENQTDSQNGPRSRRLIGVVPLPPTPPPRASRRRRTHGDSLNGRARVLGLFTDRSDNLADHGETQCRLDVEGGHWRSSPLSLYGSRGTSQSAGLSRGREAIR